MKLHTQISIALVAGALAGLASNYFGIGWLQSTLVAIEPIGTAWIDLITMVVIPLVVASLVVGTASLGDMAKLGRLGGKTVAFYLVTTAIAVTIGLVLSNVVVPGGRIDPATLESLRNAYMDESAQQVQTAQAQDTGIVDMLLGMIPRNPVAALTEMRMLPIIIFSIFLGAAVSVLPEDTGGSTVISFFDGINEASMKMVHWIMMLAPYAVFALIAAVVAQFGLEVLQSLLVYCAVVIGGLVLHLLITYTSALKFLAKVDLSEWFKAIREVPLIAFSTSSSSAVRHSTQSFSGCTTTARPSYATGSSIYSTLVSCARSTSTGLIGREALLMSVSPRRNFENPPPVPLTPTVARMSGCAAMNSSATASVMG